MRAASFSSFGVSIDLVWRVLLLPDTEMNMFGVESDHCPNPKKKVAMRRSILGSFFFFFFGLLQCGVPLRSFFNFSLFFFFHFIFHHSSFPHSIHSIPASYILLAPLLCTSFAHLHSPTSPIATMATPSPACPLTNCPTVCSPTCKQGYTCTLGVIDSLCECPAVSCVKVDFDTGTGDSGSKTPSPTPSPPSPPSKSSVLGPVLGGVFGVMAVALITFFLVRRQRRRRRTNAEQERGGEGHMDHTLAKVWVSTLLLPHLISFFFLCVSNDLEARSERRHLKLWSGCQEQGQEPNNRSGS